MSTVIANVPQYNIPILIASPDAELRRQAVQHFSTTEWSIEEAFGGADALCKLEDRRCKLLLLDRELPDLRTDDLVGIVEARFPGTDVVLMDRSTATPMIPPELLDDQLYRTLQESWHGTTAPRTTVGENAIEPLPGMIGQSAAMQSLYKMVRLVARRDTTVLVTGETGTGKELIAQSLHTLSARGAGPMVTVNCAAIPEALLEAELFGHTRGAFTGALQARIGKTQAAQGGTLFLDEVGEMELGLQAKLLRFLENGEVQRLGSSDVFHVDVRVIAATNAALEKKVKEHAFREDLYYRLAVFPVEAPPLRDRGADVLLLARHFLNRFAGSTARFDDAAEEAMCSYAWPGNVRELQHVVERAAILSDGSNDIGVEHIRISGLSARLGERVQ